MWEQWQKKAIAEGRVCPECKQPQSKRNWAEMTRYGKIQHCLQCRYNHLEIPLGAGGSFQRDNADREDLDRIRGQ